MMPDYTLGDTLDFKFSTRAFATGIPTTLAGTPVISAYPDNSVTQITAGITLTVDFDSVTGLHNIRVVATSGNGYASGSSYALVITTGTVGGVSVVGEVVASFSLGRSAAAADLANGTDGLGAIKADTAATLTDTNELQGDWTNGGRLDLIIDAVLDDTDLIDDATSGLAKIATDVAAVLVDTGTTLPATLATAQTDLDTITGADGVTLATAQALYAPAKVGAAMTLTSAYDFAKGTAAMTESYAADGAAPTPAQSLFLIQQILTEFAISSTTLTMKKLDGSTTAATFTLSDATNPTSITRAT